jgi:hypothetical protein
MYYIEWYKSEGSRGVSKGRFAVYFRSPNAAYEAMRGWLLDNKVDGFDVKEKL